MGHSPARTSSPYLYWASNPLVAETQPNSLKSKENHNFNNVSIGFDTKHHVQAQSQCFGDALILGSSQITAALRCRRQRSPALLWRELKMPQHRTPGEETAGAQSRKWEKKHLNNEILSWLISEILLWWIKEAEFCKKLFDIGRCLNSTAKMRLNWMTIISSRNYYSHPGTFPRNQADRAPAYEPPKLIQVFLWLRLKLSLTYWWKTAKSASLD